MLSRWHDKIQWVCSSEAALMNGSVPIFHKMTALDTFSWYDVLTWNCANSCPNAQSEFAIPQDNIDLHKQINKAHNNSWTVLQFYWSWLETVRWRCCSVTRGVSAGAIPKAPVESPQFPSTSWPQQGQIYWLLPGCITGRAKRTCGRGSGRFTVKQEYVVE